MTGRLIGFSKLYLSVSVSVHVWFIVLCVSLSMVNLTSCTVTTGKRPCDGQWMDGFGMAFPKHPDLQTKKSLLCNKTN